MSSLPFPAWILQHQQRVGCNAGNRYIDHTFLQTPPNEDIYQGHCQDLGSVVTGERHLRRLAPSPHVDAELIIRLGTGHDVHELAVRPLRGHSHINSGRSAPSDEHYLVGDFPSAWVKRRNALRTHAEHALVPAKYIFRLLSQTAQTKFELTFLARSVL